MKYNNIHDAISDFNASDEKMPYGTKNHELSYESLNRLITEFDCYEAVAINETDEEFNKRVRELVKNAYMIDFYTNHSHQASKITNSIIDSEHAIEVCKSFLDVNRGDEATENLILSIFCELFDCSEDLLLEIIG